MDGVYEEIIAFAIKSSDRIVTSLDGKHGYSKGVMALNVTSWTPTAARPWQEVAFFAFWTHL